MTQIIRPQVGIPKARRSGLHSILTSSQFVGRPKPSNFMVSFKRPQVVSVEMTEVIARTVGKRTVYSLREIEELCQKPVLAILFRQACVLSKPIPHGELSDHLVFQRPPQSIISIQGEGLEWLKKRLPL